MRYIIKFRIKYIFFKRSLINKVDNFARKHNLSVLQRFTLRYFVKYCQLISDEIIKLDELSRREEA